MLGHDLRCSSDSEAREWQDLVRHGYAQMVLPTTDSGYKTYGPGRLFLPAATCLCVDPQGTAATFWGTSTDHTALTPNTAVPLTVTDSPLITKCLRLVNDGTADAPVTANITVVASTAYNSSIYVYAPTLGGNLTITDEVGHTFTLAALTAANAGWVRYSVQANTVAAEVTKSLKFTFAGGTESTVYVTGYNPVASAVLTPYFDGGMQNCAWTGTANASTSTRAVSLLQYANTGFATAAALTFGCRFSPLGAGTSVTAQCPSVGFTWNATHKCNMTEYAGAVFTTMRDASGATDIAQVFTSTPGTLHTAIARTLHGSTLDLTVDGTAAAQVANPRVPTLTSLPLNTNNNSASGYQGPVFWCPARITDAETVLLDAGLTAGWGGLELFRFFRERGYANTLILPLEGDSVGYKVAA